MKNNNSVIFAVVNRKGKALLYNGITSQYKMYEDKTSDKASMRAIAALLRAISNNYNKYGSITIVLPKNLSLILRKEAVNEWISNGNKTKNGVLLDPEFICLAKYISDMRYKLGNKVRFRLTGSSICTPTEELLMKQTWNQLDKLTNYRHNNKASNKHNNKPVAPKCINYVKATDIDF